MRFGHFFYPMNFDVSRDAQVISDCLAEAGLVEQLGLDAIWIAEHHQRILLGLGVVEMALPIPSPEHTARYVSPGLTDTFVVAVSSPEARLAVLFVEPQHFTDVKYAK